MMIFSRLCWAIENSWRAEIFCTFSIIWVLTIEIIFDSWMCSFIRYTCASNIEKRLFLKKYGSTEEFLSSSLDWTDFFITSIPSWYTSTVKISRQNNCPIVWYECLSNILPIGSALRKMSISHEQSYISQSIFNQKTQKNLLYQMHWIELS
jgi:hypothetical protein